MMMAQCWMLCFMTGCGEKKNREMPVSFHFIDKVTGDVKRLVEIDEEICAMFRLVSDPVNFSMEYEMITNIGISCCFRGPFCLRTFHEMTASFDSDRCAKMLYFLDGRYKFEAWR